MKTRRTRIALLVTSLSLGIPATVHATVFGEILSLSPIGAPLRVEIAAPGNRLRDPSCLRVVSPESSTDGLPSIRRARISITGSGADTRLVVSAAEAMMEPAASLTLVDACEARFRKQYTLLFPYPVTAPVLAATQQTASPTASKRPTRGDARTWVTAPGESLDSLGKALYPHDTDTRRRFVRETLRANQDIFSDGSSATTPLPPGTTLNIPDLARLSATARPATTPARAEPRPAKPSAPAASQPATIPAPLSPLPTGAGEDRLVVAPDQPTTNLPASVASGQIKLSPLSETSLAQREQQVASAIDRTTIMQMELLERIKELEQIQARLIEQANLVAQLPAPTVVAPSPQAAGTTPPAIPEPTPSSVFDWLLPLLLGLGTGVIALTLIQRSRRGRADARTQASSTAVTNTPKPTTTQVTDNAPPQPSAPDTTASLHVAGVAPLEWDGATTETADYGLGPLAEEEEVEEHDSAIELAEIMMSFGRVHGAAETLADFIRGNPKQAVTPWLKLLEVYRAAGLRAEFDGLARQLNKTFNVKAVTWDNFDEARSAPDALEKMPHLIKTVEETWGTRECQAYLQRLLRDNRDGTRQGFPLTVIDDILCLNAVLEQQLGPYKAELEPEARPAAAYDDPPETEPPHNGPPTTLIPPGALDSKH